MQPGPVKITMAVRGSKPVPMIVKVNVCPEVVDAGVIEASCGAAAGDKFETVRETPFDAVPVMPFCTATVYVPTPRAGPVPLNDVALLLASVLLAREHGVHPGPVKVTNAVFGLKPEPTSVNVNACPALVDAGVTETSCGAGLDTVSGTLFDTGPLRPFCTATMYVPTASIGPVALNEVPLLLVSAPLAI